MEGQVPDPGSLRISDHDRHAVAEVLRGAAGEGRIDIEELDERLEATYAARTYADLVPITADLPVAGHRLPAVPRDATGATPAPVPARRAATDPAVPATAHSTSFSMMGDCTRRGLWEVPDQHTAVSVMGGVHLDLREARLTARETVIDAWAVMAGIDVTVNAWTRVVVDGVGVMGDFSQAKDKVEPQVDPDSPVVRVRGLALMGSVVVRRKEMPGETRKRLGRRSG